MQTNPVDNLLESMIIIDSAVMLPLAGSGSDAPTSQSESRKSIVSILRGLKLLSAFSCLLELIHVSLIFRPIWPICKIYIHFMIIVTTRPVHVFPNSVRDLLNLALCQPTEILR